MEKVSVLMSVYRPNPVYFEQQLWSLNEQSYENLELLIWNDCPDEPVDRELVARTVTRFPVTFYEKGKNLGYIAAFGALSELAKGDYLSYCDQDDIWERDKVALCMDAIRKNNAVAAVCDRSLMDGEGNIFCPSVRKASRLRADHWTTGEDITARAAFSSYCTGMTLIAQRRAVQRCLPFVPVLPHDQQLAFLLSGAGTLACVERPLVRHRRYGTNASGTLAGVESKRDYYDTRCKPVSALLDRYEQLYPGDGRLPAMRKCCEARVKGKPVALWRCRDMIPDIYTYEIGLALCPDFVFRRLKRCLTRKEQR